MSPVPAIDNVFDTLTKRATDAKIEKPTNAAALTLEAWAEGYMVGSLIIMSCITLANMRRGVLLHKLILLELVMGYWQGFFILFNQPIYGWWLSVAAIFLNASWSLHNVIAWMKLKPFLSKFWSRFFIGTVILVQPYWVVEIYANFTYFHNINHVFLKTRPWEALCRDPWWIAAAGVLIYNIKSKYDLTLGQIIRISPRFAVLLGALMLSVIFIVLDVLSVTSVLSGVLPIGINPFWKLSFVFKCLTDSVVLDDFKTALDRLRAFKISRLGSFAIDNNDERTKEHRDDVRNANNWLDPSPKGDGPLPVRDLPTMPSPDGDYIDPTFDDVKRTSRRPIADHVEDEKYSAVRSGSRDRDAEENAIGPVAHHDDPRREANHSHRLEYQTSWTENGRSSDSTDLDQEYAQAVREMTNDPRPERSRHSKAIGVAR